MVPTGLEERVRSLEETSQLMRNVPGRLDRIEARLDDVQGQILRSRQELTVVIHATADGVRGELRAEVRALIDDLRAEIRASEEETRRHMAVLLEHAVAQMHALFDASRRPPP